MQRETRFRRSGGAGIRTTQEPSEQFRPAAQEVFIERADTDSNAILANSFAKFFGDLTNAAQTLQNAEHRVNMMEIARDNRRQNVRGTADALAGNPMDSTLADDFDYVDAYQNTAGAVAGQKMADEFARQVAELPSNADIDAFSDTFFRSEFGNGTGQEMFDAPMANEFRKKADVVVATFKANQARVAQAKALQTLQTGVAMKANDGSFTLEDLRGWMTSATKLMPGKEHEARPWVLGRLVDAASTSLRGITRLSQVIHEPGYGPNGESFAKMFPDAAPAMENMAVDRWQAHITTQGFFEYNQLREQLADPSVASDPRKLGEIASRLETVLTNHGGFAGPYKEIRNRLEALIGGMATTVAAHNKIDAIVRGQIRDVFDQGEINKHLGNYLQSKGINPLASPEAAAQTAFVVKQLRGISTDLKDNMNTALMDSNDPQRQAVAFAFWNALDRNQGVDVTPYMSEGAERTFRALQRTLVRTDGNVNAAVALLNGDPSIRKQPKDANDADWPTLMGMAGKSRSEAVTKAQTSLRKGIAEAFGVTGMFGGGKPDNVILAGDAESDLMGAYAAALHQYRNAGDPAAADNALRDVLATVGKRYITLPVADGKLRIMRAPEGLDPTKRPGTVKNALGEDEDTVKNFRDDVRDLSRRMPGLFDEPNNLSAGYDAVITPRTGLFPLMDGHMPVMLEGGQRFKVRAKGDPNAPGRFVENPGGAAVALRNPLRKTPEAGLEDFTLSADPAEATRQLRENFPPYVTFVDMNREEREAAAAAGRKVAPVFRAFYSFRLKDQKPLEQLRDEWTAPAASEVEAARQRATPPAPNLSTIQAP